MRRHISGGHLRLPAPVTAFAPLAVLLLLAGCDESLPPREPPLVVLQQSLEIFRPGDIVIRDSVPQGTGGSFIGRVKNVYDEVLQDTARLRLILDITLLNEPPGEPARKNSSPGSAPGGERVVPVSANTAHIEANEEFLVNWRLLQRGVLTIGIDTSVVIQRQWNHMTSAGIPFWSLVELTPAVTPGGEPYLLSDTVRYRVQGTVQVFKIVQPLVLVPREVRVVYKIFKNALPASSRGSSRLRTVQAGRTPLVAP